MRVVFGLGVASVSTDIVTYAPNNPGELRAARSEAVNSVTFVQTVPEPPTMTTQYWGPDA